MTADNFADNEVAISVPGCGVAKPWSDLGLVPKLVTTAARERNMLNRLALLTNEGIDCKYFRNALILTCKGQVPLDYFLPARRKHTSSLADFRHTKQHRKTFIRIYLVSVSDRRKTS
jgi:hypothetical protein